MGAGKPWRKFNSQSEPWSDQHLIELKNAIPTISYPESKRVTKGNILLIGPVKSGKSSFINSVLGVHKGRIVQKAPDGGEIASLTREYNRFVCGNFLVCDTMGLEIGARSGFNVADIVYLVKGNVPPNYKFDPVNPITENSEGFIQSPQNKDQVHCVVFCVDANVVSPDIHTETRQKIKSLQDQIAGLRVPRILILTKIDMLDEYVKDDIGYTFKSSKVKDAVQMASEIFNIPEMYIHPVKNFTSEQAPTSKSSILMLSALKQAVEFAQDSVEELQDET